MKKIASSLAAFVAVLVLVPTSLATGESKHSMPFTRSIQTHHFVWTGELKSGLPFTRVLLP
jgi:hypothetical protein